MTSASAIAVSGSGEVRAGSAQYRGFAFRNTGAGMATIDIFDNASAASGTLLDTIDLNVGESAREHYPDGGIWVVNGIYVSITGTVTGSVRLG